MKKIHFLSFFILLFLLNITLTFSLQKPKGDDVGALVGKIYLKLEDDWKTQSSVMKAGEYYKGIVFIKNNETGKEYQVFTNLNGLYYLLNVPGGNYTIYRFNYEYITTTGSYRISSTFKQSAEILPNKITVKKTILIKKFLLPFDESKNRISSTNTTRLMTQSIEIEDEIDIIKELFKKIDRTDLWSNFEWNENN